MPSAGSGVIAEEEVAEGGELTSGADTGVAGSAIVTDHQTGWWR